MFRIDALSGAKTLLWKISQDGAPSQFSVADDGIQIAFTVSLSKPQARKEIQIRSLSDGSLIHSVDTKTFVEPSWMQISKTILLAYHNSPPTAFAYSLVEKRQLWKRDLKGSSEKEFLITPDEKEILLVGADNGIDQVDAANGNLVSRRDLNLVGGDINYHNGSVITQDQKRRFSLVNVRGLNKIRACELSTGRVQFETVGRPGWSSVGLLPEQGLVASWHGRPPRSNAVCFYDWNDGSLLRSIPFFGPVGYATVRGLHVSGSTLAINLGRTIRLFQTAITPPHSSMSRASKEGTLHWLAGSQQTFATKLVTSGTSESLVISLMDPGGVLSSKSPNNRASVQGFLKGRPPWFLAYQRNQFLVGIHDYRCSVFKLESGGIKLLWGKWIPSTSGIMFGAATPHPTKDLLWTRANVLQMSTGQIITKMKRDSIQGVDWVPSVWLADDRDVEIGIRIVKGSDVEDDEFSRSLLLWDTISRDLITTAPAPNCKTICLMPDGSSVIEGTSDKRVRVRDAKTLQEKISFRAHDDAITSIECHPELPLLITFSSGESLIRIWDLGDFSMREEIRTSGKADGINVTTDGNKIFVWSQAKVDVYQPESFKR
jgi:WD40 repeat protein